VNIVNAFLVISLSLSEHLHLEGYRESTLHLPSTLRRGISKSTEVAVPLSSIQSELLGGRDRNIFRTKESKQPTLACLQNERKFYKTVSLFETLRHQFTQETYDLLQHDKT